MTDECEPRHEERMNELEPAERALAHRLEGVMRAAVQATLRFASVDVRWMPRALVYCVTARMGSAFVGINLAPEAARALTGGHRVGLDRIAAGLAQALAPELREAMDIIERSAPGYPADLVALNPDGATRGTDRSRFDPVIGRVVTGAPAGGLARVEIDVAAWAAVQRTTIDPPVGSWASMHVDVDDPADQPGPAGRSTFVEEDVLESRFGGIDDYNPRWTSSAPAVGLATLDLGLDPADPMLGTRAGVITAVRSVPGVTTARLLEPRPGLVRVLFTGDAVPETVLNAAQGAVALGIAVEVERDQPAAFQPFVMPERPAVAHQERRDHLYPWIATTGSDLDAVAARFGLRRRPAVHRDGSAEPDVALRRRIETVAFQHSDPERRWPLPDATECDAELARRIQADLPPGSYVESAHLDPATLVVTVTASMPAPNGDGARPDAPRIVNGDVLDFSNASIDVP